jgi:FAD/FMN-containing dehydrogenase
MLRYSVKTFVLDAASRYLDMNIITDHRLAHRWVDEGDRIICPIEDLTTKMRVVRRLSRDWRETEPAVPVEAAPAVLERLDRLLHDHRYAMLNAVGLRTSAADTFSLSPCFGRDTFWIDIFFTERDAAFAADLAGLVEAYDGRCHWGKHISLDPGHLRGQYPRLGEFRKIRAELDPNRLFSSAYTRRIGV